MLRAAREQQGLSLEDVAARTRVRPAFLQALEEGRYDKLPGPVYTRGFLKLYARAVGLDPATVVEAWERQTKPWAVPKVASPRPQRGERSRPWCGSDPLLRSMEPRQRLRSAASATLVVVLAAVAGAWLLSTATKGPAQDVRRLVLSVEPGDGTKPGRMSGEAGGVADEVPTTPSTPALQSEPALPASGQASGPAAGVGGTWPADAQARLEPPVPPQPAPAPPSQPASAPSNPAFGPARQDGSEEGVEVVAVVREAGWIEAFADGQRVFSGTAQAGDRLTWRARRLLSLRFGRAEGVELVVNGKPAGPAGRGVTTRHFFAPTETGRP